MKRILVAAVLAAGAALAGCGRGGPSTTGVISWEPLPPAATTTTTSTTTTLVPEPACVASQLQATPGPGGAAAGNDETTVLLTDIGSPCRLAGYPALVGITISGDHVRLDPMHGTFFTDPVPGDASRGEGGEFLIGTADACAALNQPSQAASVADAAANTYTGAILTLPGGAGVMSVSGLRFDTACGVDESQVGVAPPPPSTGSIPPGSPQALAVTVHVPPSVRSGIVLDYQVRLENPTSTPIALSPCPNYTEAFGVPARFAGRTYRLNCGPGRLFSPGETRVFAMEIAVPKVDRNTVAKFSWVLDTGVGPSAGLAVRVLP